MQITSTIIQPTSHDTLPDLTHTHAMEEKKRIVQTQEQKKFLFELLDKLDLVTLVSNKDWINLHRILTKLYVDDGTPLSVKAADVGNQFYDYLYAHKL
jgi:hypothetical protein